MKKLFIFVLVFVSCGMYAGDIVYKNITDKSVFLLGDVVSGKGEKIVGEKLSSGDGFVVYSINKSYEVFLKERPNFHFKFYKKPIDVNIVIGMLGYFEDNKYCIYHFIDDDLNIKIEFVNKTEYYNYIKNDNEKNNIIIKNENLTNK